MSERGMTAAEAQASMRAIADVINGPIHDTVVKARSAYVQGRIELDEFERRLDAIFISLSRLDQEGTP